MCILLHRSLFLPTIYIFRFFLFSSLFSYSSSFFSSFSALPTSPLEKLPKWTLYITESKSIIALPVCFRSELHCLFVNTTSWEIFCFECNKVIYVDSHKKLYEAVEFIKKTNTKPNKTTTKARTLYIIIFIPAGKGIFKLNILIWDNLSCLESMKI